MMLAHGYGGFLWLVVAVLDIYAIIKIVQSGAEPIWKALWIVIVLALPVLGLLLCLLVHVIINIVRSSAEPFWKTLWIVFVVVLPLPGLILWFLFGPKG